MKLSDIYDLNEHTDRILVTCALPYVNNVPHLGNMVPILSADVYSRFLKLKGIRSIYVCATDEHGTRTEIEAAKVGLDENAYCQQLHDRMLEVFRWFNVDFDHFGRTSCEDNHKLTQELFLKALEKGAILEDEIQQLYSAEDDMYLPDTYVIGTCPYCGNTAAQGDQCDQCGRLLDPLELIEPRSKVSGAIPEVRSTRHLFLRLDELSPRLKAWIESQDHWEGIIRNMPLGWIGEGLRPRAITRDLKWGVKVPKEGFEDKVFYVWFDAPVGYVGATAEWARANNESLEDWWKGGKARLIHFLGKDNVPFHTLMWPATLLAADDGWNLPTYIASNEYLNYDGESFSKSRNVGVFSEDAAKLDFPADAWRFYIIANRPEKRDFDFDFEGFQNVIKTALVGNFGNLVNRVLSFTHKRIGSIPEASKLTQHDQDTLAAMEAKTEEIFRAYEHFELRQVARLVLELGDIGNQYFQEAQPWSTFKTDRAACETTLHVAAQVLHRLAQVCWPIMPERCETVLGWMKSDIHSPFKAGVELDAPTLLFQNVDDDVIAKLKAEYGGAAEEEAAAEDGQLEFVKEPEVTWPCVILELEDLTIKRRIKSLRKQIKARIAEVDLEALAASPQVQAYNELIEKYDKGARHSVQNLIDIVGREGKLPNINSLVDIYNTWSLTEGIVMGAYDLRAVKGRLIYAQTDGTEHFYPVKGSDPVKIEPGEWVIKDDANMVITRVASKQAEAVAIQGDTTRCAICVQGHPGISVEKLKEVAEGMAHEISERCGGSWRMVFAG